MLDLTTGSNYSFHIVLLLARAGPGQVVSIAQLADGVQASPTYMAKLLKRLAEAELVQAHRGRSGGYSLARPPDSISLWDVVAALGASEPATTALLPLCSGCPLAAECPIRDILHTAWDDIHRRLATVSVGSLVKRLEATNGPGPFDTPSGTKRRRWPRAA